MELAIFLGLQLFAILWPTKPMLLIAIVVGTGLLWRLAGKVPKRNMFPAVLLLVLPLFLLTRNASLPSKPSFPDVAELAAYTEVERFLTESQQAHIAEVLGGRTVGLSDLKTSKLLDEVQLPAYVSLTILNLNREPMVWKGAYFSESYTEAIHDQAYLNFRDGRLFFSKLMATPNKRQTQGYLVLDVLLHTNHVVERRDSWLCKGNSANLVFRSTIVEQGQSQVLAGLGASLNAPPLVYDLNFIVEPEYHKYMDSYVVVWTICFLLCLIFLRQLIPIKSLLACYGSFLVLLGLPLPAYLDSMTAFGSYVFGHQLIANLFSSPFHSFMSLGILFLLIFCVCVQYLRNKPYVGVIGFVVFLSILIPAPAFFQQFNILSFIHPLDAFSSPGALLSHLGFLGLFAYTLLIFAVLPKERLVIKLPVITLALVVMILIWPQSLISVLSFSLMWLVKDMTGSATLKAALVVLVFYPSLVRQEQQKELAYVRDHLLDEITLLVERNHFRMGRIIQRLPELLEQMDLGIHPHLMEIFAKEAGLFEDDIDFALRLTDQNGKLISEIKQHIPLERIPYFLGPENRIASYQNEPGAPDYLIFRRNLATVDGEIEFVAVLGNDYQNLSLVRQLRRIDRATQQWRDTTPLPHFAYRLDVYDIEGHPLYNQREVSHLKRDDLQTMKEQPHHWYTKGRDTFFLFRDRDYVYRITHKATPMRMVFARFLALFLVMTLIVKAVQLSMRPGRSLLSRWKRSFTMKLAGFMFLCAVLPTSMLGYFLISSIQKNQLREEASLARSQIKAAKELFHEVTNNSREENMVNSNLLNQDLSLYLSGSLKITNQPEVFRNGLMNRRLDAALAKEIYLDKKTVTLKREQLADGSSIVIAYATVTSGSKEQAVLAMTMLPFSQRQKSRWREQLEFSLTLLFGLLFLMAILTRFFAKSYLRPVSAITRSASRMAKGIDYRPIEIQRQDELELMVDAYNTMQQRIQESHSRLESQVKILDETLKSMSSGLVGFDGNGKILLGNNKCWELLDIHDNYPKNIQELVGQVPALEPITHDSLEVSFIGGTTLEPIEMLAKLRQVPNAEHQNLKTILIVEDITNAMAANRFKAWSEMARRVAHEIKNPLTPIQLEMDYLTKLYKDQHPSFGEALADAAEQIGKQVQDLRRTATEFSDYARPIDPELIETNLTEMLETLLEPYEKTLPELKVESFLAENLIHHVDARLLRRSFHNLIVNAVQAMEEEGQLRVRLFDDGSYINLWIEDTGPGIPLEEHHRVFDAYFSTKDQGTGLGLVIARKYIEVHNGLLSIDHNYTDGTRFVIQLPK